MKSNIIATQVLEWLVESEDQTVQALVDVKSLVVVASYYGKVFQVDGD